MFGCVQANVPWTFESDQHPETQRFSNFTTWPFSICLFSQRWVLTLPTTDTTLQKRAHFAPLFKRCIAKQGRTLPKTENNHFFANSLSSTPYIEQALLQNSFSGRVHKLVYRISSVSLFLCRCLSVSVFLSLSLSLSLFFLNLSLCLSHILSVSLSVSQPDRRSVSRSAGRSSVCLPPCIFACLTASVSLSIFVCLSFFFFIPFFASLNPSFVFSLSLFFISPVFLLFPWFVSSNLVWICVHVCIHILFRKHALACKFVCLCVCVCACVKAAEPMKWRVCRRLASGDKQFYALVGVSKTFWFRPSMGGRVLPKAPILVRKQPPNILNNKNGRVRCLEPNHSVFTEQPRTQQNAHMLKKLSFSFQIVLGAKFKMWLDIENIEKGGQWGDSATYRSICEKKIWRGTIPRPGGGICRGPLSTSTSKTPPPPNNRNANQCPQGDGEHPPNHKPVSFRPDFRRLWWLTWNDPVLGGVALLSNRESLISWKRPCFLILDVFFGGAWCRLVLGPRHRPEQPLAMTSLLVRHTLLTHATGASNCAPCCARRVFLGLSLCLSK